MRDAKVAGTVLLVDSFKKVVQETIEFPDGQKDSWIYLDSPKSIMVLAITPEHKIVLVKQIAGYNTFWPLMPTR